MDKENIEQILNSLGTEQIPADVHKIAVETSDSFTKTLTQTKRLKHHLLWEYIMKSAITKLAVAAAIVVAVVVGTHQFVRSVPAFADVVRPLLTAHTATFKGTMKTQGAPTQTFDGMYMEPIHMRQVTPQGVIVVSDLEQGKIVTLMPAEKKAFVMEMENIPENEDQSQFNMFHEIRKHIQEAQDTGGKSAEFLGEHKIDGVAVIGYRVQKPGVDITVWADAKTLLPVQMENTMGPVTFSMSDIVFDAVLDETLFSLEIPKGYTVQTMKVDASEPTEKDLIEMFRIWADNMDGNLPSVLDMNASMEFVKYQQKKMKEQGQGPSEQSVLELQKTIMKMGRGGMFVQQLPPESDWHYAGKGLKLGDSNTAIFWYRPNDPQTYRVIYGDLSVADVAAEDLPK